MVMSVEPNVGAVAGSQGVKLEEQTIISDDRPEMISEAAYDERLLAWMSKRRGCRRGRGSGG